MDTSKTKPTKRNRLICLLAPLALLVLAGCNVKIIDLTPSVIKANPSNVYTLTAQIAVKNSAVAKETLRPQIVIDGNVHPMSLSPGSENLYEYDFPMPMGRTDAAYYILVHYERKTENGTASKEEVTELKRFSVENRYSVALEVNRAPVGTRVAILGRGFTRDDKIMVGGSPASTRFDSSTSLSFYVPSLPEGRGYGVTVIGANGEIDAGNLRIDASQVTVLPSSLTLSRGESRVLVFRIPEEAPPGGLLIQDTTDIPQSIIMDRVKIEAGQRSTSVNIQGGSPGQGSLFVRIPGYADVVVPITVN
jgi:hypothetical protein